MIPPIAAPNSGPASLVDQLPSDDWEPTIVAAGRNAGALVTMDNAVHHADLGVNFILSGATGWIEAGHREMERRAGV